MHQYRPVRKTLPRYGLSGKRTISAIRLSIKRIERSLGSLSDSTSAQIPPP